jgi:hypothetical protein
MGAMDQYPQPPAPLSPPPVNQPGNYLDSIAPQPTQPTIKPWLLWTIIGGVISLLIVVVLAIAIPAGPSKSDQLLQLTWRMQAVSSLADTHKQTIKSSSLRATNSSLLAILDGAKRDSTAFLSEEAAKQKQPKESPLIAEFSELETRLEDARLNVIFDTVYAREMAYQVATLQSEMKSLLPGASRELSSYLTQADKNLEPLVKQLSEFSNSQS